MRFVFGCLGRNKFTFLTVTDKDICYNNKQQKKKVIEYDKTWEGIVRDAGLNVSEEAPFSMDDFLYELNSLLNKYGVILEPDVYEDWDEDINGEYHLCSLEPYIVVEDNKTGVVYLETYSLPVGELVGDCIFK